MFALQLKFVVSLRLPLNYSKFEMLAFKSVVLAAEEWNDEERMRCRWDNDGTRPPKRS